MSIVRLIVLIGQIYDPEVLFRGQVVIEEVDRVDLDAILFHFIMKMWCGTETCIAYIAN